MMALEEFQDQISSPTSTSTADTLKKTSPSFKRGKYQQITDEQRNKLLYLVFNENLSIQQASKEAGIIYNTSKSILQVYKNENGRVGKKKKHSKKLASRIFHSKEIALREQTSLQWDVENRNQQYINNGQNNYSYRVGFQVINDKGQQQDEIFNKQCSHMTSKDLNQSKVQENNQMLSNLKTIFQKILVQNQINEICNQYQSAANNDCCSSENETSEKAEEHNSFQVIHKKIGFKRNVMFGNALIKKSSQQICQ